MIVMLDNYDSFTYNLVQLMAGQGADIRVYRNDAVDIAAIEALSPRALIVSPGPCTPAEAGISVEAIRHFSGRLPLLGVCLGHQSLGVAFGATVAGAKAIMHGKTSSVHHDGSALYAGLRNPFPAGRYHSLAVLRETLPACLAVTAWTDDGEIMGMRHTAHETYGVQFHPESVLTPAGKKLLRNFLRLAGEV